MAWPWIIAVLGVPAVVAAALFLLVIRRSGTRDGDAGDFAGRVIDQSSLTGGGTKPGEQPWDGVDRLKTPPTDVGY